MHELSPAALLDVWEWGLTQPHDEKALTLLGAAFPDEPELETRSVGRRNTLLLNFHDRFFGPQWVAVATCPQCAARLELNFETSDILAPPAEEAETLTVESSGYQVQCRLPNSVDLARVRGLKDVADVERTLLRRCLLSARHGEDGAPVEELPAEVVEKVVQAMDQADPQANIQLLLTCQICEHRWRAGLDIVSYLWSELDTWARRILQEVHSLASAYGWDERDILNMRPWRRQIYMEMIGR